MVHVPMRNCWVNERAVRGRCRGAEGRLARGGICAWLCAGGG